MISKLHIQNYKALRDVTVELTPIHVLIGPNDAGKSSILEAAYALVQSARKPLKDCFPGLWEGLDLVWKHDPGHMVSFLADIDSYHYGFACRFSHGPQNPILTQEYTGQDGRTHELPLYSSDQTRMAVSLANPQAEDQLWDQNQKAIVQQNRETAKNLLRILTGAHSYRWDPRYLSMPSAPDSRWKFRLQPTGFGLPRCLDDILGYDRKLFDRLESAFTTIFPEFSSIKLEQCPAFRSDIQFVGRDIPRLQGSEGKRLVFELRSTGTLMPASQLSDGVLIVLAYLTIMHLPKPPAILLIEEPENGIHPKRLQEIARMLRSLVEREPLKTQILMTSHSPYLIDEFKPEEVTLCRKDAKGEIHVRRLSDSERVRKQLDIFTLGEIWTGEDEGSLASDENETTDAEAH